MKSEPAVKEQQNQIMPPSESRIVRKSSISIKGSLTGDSQKLEEPVKQDEIKASPEDSVPPVSAVPNPKKLLESWNNYAQSIESSNPRVYSTLKSHPPKIDMDGRMKITLNSEAQKENFTKNIKPGLVEFLRKDIGPGDYLIEAMVEANNITEKKIYTDQDKFNYLSEKNPELGKLKSSFNLDFDN